MPFAKLELKKTFKYEGFLFQKISHNQALSQNGRVISFVKTLRVVVS